MDEDGISLLHYYDSAIQLVRTSSKEPTEEEFEIGIEAAKEIIKRSVSCEFCVFKADILTTPVWTSFGGCKMIHHLILTSAVWNKMRFGYRRC
jgi:hypothetical protein